MGYSLRLWFFALELTVVLFALTCVPGVTAQCQMFSQCTCTTVINGRSVDVISLVDCSSKNLTAIPTPDMSYMKPIYEFRLSNNSIVSLGATILLNLNITKLDLGNNAINSVDSNAFGSLGNYLKILILSGDSVGTPPSNAFQPLQHLEELTLQNYNVPHLNHTHAFFLSFSKLKQLTLDKWNMESVDPVSFQMQSYNTLLSLALLNQMLRTLPLDLLHEVELVNLRKLQISDTLINQVTNFAFSKLNFIQELDLSSNHIDTLMQNCFSDIGDTLVKLSLSKNAFADDANKLSGLVDLTNLEVLDLSSNGMTAVPNLSQLRTLKLLNLNLSKNRISSLLQNAFAGIADKLLSLDLSQNDIMNIDPNSFTGVTTMQSLFLSQLSRTPLILPASLTQAASTLKQLYVDRQAVSLSEFWSVIGRLYNLEDLNINSAQLGSIPDMALVSLTNLKKLDLSYNSLKEIKQDALIGPRNTLSYLSLTGNSIPGLPSCLFYQYTSYPITMALGSNYLTCDCAVKWLWDRITNGSVVFVSGQEATCNDKTLLASKKVKDFCPSPNSDPLCTATLVSGLTVSLEPLSSNSVKATWQMSDIIDLKSFTVTLTNSNSPIPAFESTFPPTITSTTITTQKEYIQHEVCVVALFNSRPSVSVCSRVPSYVPSYVPSSTTETTAQQQGLNSEEIGIIVGAVVGAVVLLAILVAIGYIVIFRRAPKKKVPSDVPVQPRTFSKPELPSMNDDTRTFSKPRRPKGSDVPQHRDGMQVVAISDGHIGNGRVGRAHMLNADGSLNNSGGSKPSSTSSISSPDMYENDRGPLPPTPSRHPSMPAGYYNMGYRDDHYDVISPGNGKESIL